MKAKKTSAGSFSFSRPFKANSNQNNVPGVLQLGAKVGGPTPLGTEQAGGLTWSQ